MLDLDSTDRKAQTSLPINTFHPHFLQGTVYKDCFLLRATIHFQHDSHIWGSGIEIRVQIYLNGFQLAMFGRKDNINSRPEQVNKMAVSDVQELILGKTNGKLNHGWNWFCYGRYWQQLKPLKDLFQA